MKAGSQLNVFSDLLLDAQVGRAVWLVTLTKAPPAFQSCLGQQLLLYSEGLSKGCIVDEQFTTEILQYFVKTPWDQPCLFQLNDRPDFEFFGDKLVQQRQAIIFGAGHISQPLVEVLSMIGYVITVADDRPDFANTQRFPKAAKVFCGSFTNAFSELAITQTTAVVIVTRGHQHDLACLRHTLCCPAFYIGMIGSKRKISTVFESLREEGASEALLNNVWAPIGLDLHAQTPAEIALSIAAEILAVEKGGTGLPLRSLWRRVGVD